MLRRISCALSATWVIASVSGCAIGGYQASDMFAPVEEPDEVSDSSEADPAGDGMNVAETRGEADADDPSRDAAGEPIESDGSAGQTDNAEDVAATENEEEDVGDEPRAMDGQREVLEELLGRRGTWFGDLVTIEVADKTDTRELDALGGEHFSHLYRVVVTLEETAESRAESCELVLADGMHIAALVEPARGTLGRRYEFVFFHDGEAALEGARFVVKRAGVSGPVEVLLGEFVLSDGEI
jgi:hypothetical protein